MNKIIGNTVGLPNPRTDWSQSDKTKADYLKNKEELKKELDGKAEALIFESEKATPLVLNDTAEAPLIDYKIYGNADGVGGEYDDSTGMFMLPVKVYGKNIWKTTSAPDSYSGGVTINDDYSITVGAGSVGSANLNVRKLSVYTATSDGESLIVSCRNVSSNIYLAIAYKPYGASTEYANLYSGTKKYTLTKGSTLTAYVQLKANAKITTPITVYPQLEFGSVATAYEKYVEPRTVYIPMPHYMIEGDYVDFKNKKVVSEGVTYENVDLPDITTNYPSTSLICGGEMEVTYKADTTNAYKNLKSELDIMKRAIIELGGME